MAMVAGLTSCGLPLTSITVGVAIAFFQIAVVCFVVDVAIGLPDGLAGLLVERDHVLLVEAVEGQDQQVAEENRRRGRPAVVIAGQVATSPKDFAGLHIETGSAGLP